MHKGTSRCRLSVQNKWTTISGIKTKEWDNKYSAGQQFMSLDIVRSTLDKMSALVVRTVSWIKLCPSVNACLFHFRRRNVFSKNMSYSKSSRFGILYCFVTSLMMQRLLNMQKFNEEKIMTNTFTSSMDYPEKGILIRLQTNKIYILF